MAGPAIELSSGAVLRDRELAAGGGHRLCAGPLAVTSQMAIGSSDQFAIGAAAGCDWLLVVDMFWSARATRSSPRSHVGSADRAGLVGRRYGGGRGEVSLDGPRA